MEYPGAVYHVMNRGDRREPIFRDDKDRVLFLATLSECCGKTGWAVTVKWLAERLQMGSPGYVNLLLYRRRKADRNAQSI